MVNINLNVDGPPLLFLNIPNSDILRLSIRPYKWIRYTMFSICGVRGDLSMAPNGQPVDYDSTSLADVVDLYYNPSELCLFVDHDGLRDQSTSSDRTPCRDTFRDDIIKRDGDCVVTETAAYACDAVHLIPSSKGHEYIDKVVRDRSPRYESPPSISDINAVENGVLLAKDLHQRLGTGQVALLKTPNYGLEPTDITRFDQGPARGTHYITLQQWTKLRGHRDHPVLSTEENLHPDIAYRYGAHVDAQFHSSEQGTLLPLPPAIILDYAYGVAAYRMWRSDPESVHDVMSAYHRKNYADIPPPPRRIPTGASQNRAENEMAQAMDDLNLFLMRVNGITPQDLADKWEKRMEEERVAQEKSRSKVAEWMRTGSTFSPTDLSSKSA